MTLPVAPAWRAWVAENLLRGNPPAELRAALVAQGLDQAAADALIDATRADPIYAAAARVAGRAAAVEQAARLMRQRSEEVALSVDKLDEPTFYERYWQTHRPVVARGLASGWPAARWTLADLADRVGETTVSVLRGRSATPRWWLHREALTTRMSLAELARLALTTEGDDVYAVGRNDLLAEPGLAGLGAELGWAPGIAAHAPHARLWVGPRGTFTPLHHDQSSAWLVQIVGTKQVWLASPLEVALLATADGVFNTVDAGAPHAGELAEVRWYTLTLSPGDAVFLPAGWWHQVRATAPSVSVSLGGFRWPHAVTWYAPGRALAAARG